MGKIVEFIGDTPPSQKQRGRPFEPGNRFGRGRPKGSRNKQTQQVHELLREQGPAIAAQAISQSRDDPKMLQFLVAQVVKLKETEKVGKLPLATLGDLDNSSRVLLERAVAGRITLETASELMKLLDHRREVLVARDMERRVSELEKASPEKKDE